MKLIEPSGKTIYQFDRTFMYEPKDFGDFLLIQAGRRYLDDHTVVGDHTHLDCFELTIATKGSAKVSADGEYSTVNAGDLYLSFPGDIHNIVTENEKLDYDYFAFVCKSGALLDAFDGVWQFKHQRQSRIFRDEKIQYLLSNLISEFIGPDEFSDLVVANIARQNIIYSARDVQTIAFVSPDVSDAKVLCQQMMNYLDTHIYSVKNLSELSNVFSYNYSYLSDLFKNTTGTTLNEYFTNRKLETARIMIKKDGKTLSDISELLGYSSPFSLSRAFKKKFGVSPIKIKNGD